MIRMFCEQVRRHLLLKTALVQALTIGCGLAGDAAYQHFALGDGLAAWGASVVVSHLVFGMAILAACTAWFWHVAKPLGEVRTALERLRDGNANITLTGMGRTDDIGHISRLLWSCRNTLLSRSCTPDRLAGIGGVAGLQKADAAWSVPESARKAVATAGQPQGPKSPDSEVLAFTFGGMLAGIRSTLVARASEKSIRLVFDTGICDQTPFLGDPLPLAQVLTHLISNAIRFSCGGEIVVSIREQGRRGSTVDFIISVRDPGTGMTSEQLGRLFPTPQLPIGYVGSRHRTKGLGLTICKGLVGSMGGTLWAESAYGQGCTFYFTLSLLVSRDALPRPLAATGNGVLSSFRSRMEGNRAERTNASRLQGKSVLLAQDAGPGRDLLEEFLRESGADVRIAGNGLEVLQLVREEIPDCILMDGRLPFMSGVETASELRSIGYARPPIIALGVSNSPAERQACLAAGINDVVGRPVNFQTLLGILGKWITAPRVVPMGAAQSSAVADETGPLPTLPPGIDVDSGLRRLGGKISLFLKALRIFRDSRGHQFQLEFKVAVAAEDWQTSERLAHGLQRTAANIGATELSTAAARLEGAIRAGAYAEVQSLLSEVNVKLSAIVDGLAHIG